MHKTAKHVILQITYASNLVDFLTCLLASQTTAAKSSSTYELTALGEHECTNQMKKMSI